MSRRPVPIWRGSVDKDGKLFLEGRSLLDRYLFTLRNQVVACTFRKAGRPKSHSQLGYLWGIIYPVIAEHFGYTEYELDAVHDELCRVLRGLKPEPNPLHLRWSLSEQDHEETGAYITDVRHWALTEHAIVTPDAERVEVPKERKRKAS